MTGDPGARPVVRLGTPADAEPVAAIDLKTWAVDNSPGPAPTGNPALYATRLAQSEVLVAEWGGAVAGYLGLEHPSRLVSNRHVGLLYLAVHPDYQGRGVATQLLLEAERVAKERGIRKLSLRVLASNPGARRVYDRLGYREEGRLIGEFLIDGILVDDILMAKWLR